MSGKRVVSRDVRLRQFMGWVTVAPSGCWEWQGCINRQGYGVSRWTVDGVTHRLAHRVSFLLHGGVPVDGLVLDHLCSNRKCVNPNHLEQVTQAENVRRAHAGLTHCVKGHSLVDAYVYNGKRICRPCRMERSRKKYHEQKAKFGSAAPITPAMLAGIKVVAAYPEGRTFTARAFDGVAAISKASRPSVLRTVEQMGLAEKTGNRVRNTSSEGGSLVTEWRRTAVVMAVENLRSAA